MISVIGAGYVGLVTGTCFADSGAEVTFLDVDEKRVQSLSRGVIPIHEPGLEEVFAKNLAEGRIRATTSAQEAFAEAAYAFVTVGTPPREDGSSDLSQVEAAVRAVASHAPRGLVLTIKSTVPVGTADWVRGILEEMARTDVSVVSNPEFLREGQALKDFVDPDRVVIGCREREAGESVAALHRPYLGSNTPVFLMDNRSAEMTKYTANAFLATRISFINEIANLCERLGADVERVRLAAGADKRIGSHFFYPGVGYGGSCFPKDVQALRSLGDQHGYATKLISAVHEVNEGQKHLMFSKIRSHFDGDLAGKRIGVWGLSFKRDTDDIRESPTLTLINDLVAAGCIVQVYDPASVDRVRECWDEGVIGCASQYDAATTVDALVVMTDWQVFSLPNWKKLQRLMAGNVVFDGRNLYRPDDVTREGFTHVSIGRADASPVPAGE